MKVVSLSALHYFITLYQIQVLLRIVLWHYIMDAEPESLEEEEGVPFENVCHAVIIEFQSLLSAQRSESESRNWHHKGGRHVRAHTLNKSVVFERNISSFVHQQLLNNNKLLEKG
jgi:hypothetical protein